MKRFFVIVVLMVAVQQANSIQSISTVEGVVTDAMTNLPVEGVTVSLISDVAVPVGADSTVLKAAITDAQGRFSIAEVSSGRYRVVPERTGFVFATRPGMKMVRDPGVWIQVSAAQAVSSVSLNMTQAAVITGRVLDNKGQPAPGNVASVVLMRYAYNDSGKRTLGSVPGLKLPTSSGSSVRMNDRGEYRFYGLAAGDYYVQVLGGPRGGTPPKLPVTIFYPGSMDEAGAVAIHVEAGDEVHLDTMTFRQADASRIRLNFVDVGDPPQSRRTYLGEVMVVTNSSQPMNLQLRPGHYEGLVTTSTTFGRVSFDLGSDDIEKEVVMQNGIHVKVEVALEDESGKRSTFSSPSAAFRCSLRSETTHNTTLCSGIPREAGYYVGTGIFGPYAPPAIPPDSYRLEIPTIPVDHYVLAATVSGRDVSHAVISIEKDIQIDVVLSASGAVLRGGVRNAGEKLQDAVVALVPDDPLSGIGDLYRSGITDTKGNFELRSIVPGNYHLYAWPELEGAAYRNAEFMKKYEDRGIAMKIEKGNEYSQDITAPSE